MNRHFVRFAIALASTAALMTTWREGAAAQTGKAGSIKGQVRLAGKSPGNPVIRMGIDPMCTKINAGKRVVDEIVVTSADGGLANAFVSLQGKFAATPAPAAPVTIDQRSCMYVPRMVVARVGQTLQVRNSDPLLHNVHTLSTKGNDFNIGQPMAGMVYDYRLKSEEIVLRLRCDVHRWMAAYIGVVSHPFAAATASGGGFEIANVPPGTYTIRAWHERYGEVSQPVTVKAGATATVNFSYSGTEKPPSAGIRDLILPETSLRTLHAGVDPAFGDWFAPGP
jgi:hypothetical protein